MTALTRPEVTGLRTNAQASLLHDGARLPLADVARTMAVDEITVSRMVALGRLHSAGEVVVVPRGCGPHLGAMVRHETDGDQAPGDRAAGCNGCRSLRPQMAAGVRAARQRWATRTPPSHPPAAATPPPSVPRTASHGTSAAAPRPPAGRWAHGRAAAVVGTFAASALVLVLGAGLTGPDAEAGPSAGIAIPDALATVAGIGQPPVLDGLPTAIRLLEADSSVDLMAATTWDRLAGCTSGGDWTIDSGNGRYGGLQFSPESWRMVGGQGLPSEASRDEQVRRAQALWQIQGWEAWPSCATLLGYR